MSNLTPVPSEASGANRHGRFLVWGAVGIVVLLLALVGYLVPLHLLLILAFGWVRYLWTTLPRVTVDGPGVVTTVAVLVGVVTCAHLIARWFARNANRSAASETPAEPEARPRWPLRRTLALVGIVLVVFAAGLSGTAVVHQIVWLARSPEPLTQGSLAMIQAAHRTQSKNNLKQLGLALHNYHDTYNVLPMGGTFDERGRPHHSWMTNFHPFIESSPIFSNVDRDRPWNHPSNSGVFRFVIPTYVMPRVTPDRIGEDPLAPGAAHYSGNAHVLGANRCTAFAEMTDGLANTLLVGEAAGNFKAWGDPTNVRDPVLGINKTPAGFGGPWRGGANFLLGDGAVRFISEAIDPRVLEALATPGAGDRVGEF